MVGVRTPRSPGRPGSPGPGVDNTAPGPTSVREAAARHEEREDSDERAGPGGFRPTRRAGVVAGKVLVTAALRPVGDVGPHASPANPRPVEGPAEKYRPEGNPHRGRCRIPYAERCTPHQPQRVIDSMLSVTNRSARGIVPESAAPLGSERQTLGPASMSSMQKGVLVARGSRRLLVTPS